MHDVIWEALSLAVRVCVGARTDTNPLGSCIPWL